MHEITPQPGIHGCPSMPCEPDGADIDHGADIDCGKDAHRRIFALGAHTSKGGRWRNEDSLVISGDFACVSDGIGGARHGDVTSRLACSTMRDEWEALSEQGLSLGERMRLALSHVDSFLSTVAARLGGGPGATIVAMACEASSLVVGSVGDSRAYVLDGETAVPVLPETGRVQDGDNALSAALGYGMLSLDEGLAEIAEVPIADGFRVLLCTDGVWTVLTEREMGELLANGGSAPWPIAHQLVGQAVSAGGEHGDNATALVGIMAGSRQVSGRLDSAPPASLEEAKEEASS